MIQMMRSRRAQHLALAGVGSALAASALTGAQCEPISSSFVELKPSKLSSLVGEARLQRASECHLIHSRRGEGQFEEFAVYHDEAAPSTLVAIIRFGDTLEGHPGIVHGGATASVCDDLFGLASLMCVPETVRGRPFFTANLTVNYRAPLRTGTNVRVRVRADELDGRKLRMHATVERESDGRLIAEASTLFIKASRTQEWTIYLASWLRPFGISLE